MRFFESGNRRSGAAADVSLDEVTAIIKTFERPRCLDRLLRSIRRFYPQLKIIVGDDSFRPHLRTDVEYVCFQPDIGLSAGRNQLLARVETQFFLLLDDDLEFTRHTQLERLLEIARQPGIALAAGDYIRCKCKFGLLTQRRPQPYHGTFHIEGAAPHRKLRLQRGYRARRNGYCVCDLVHNFFIAKTDAIRRLGGWDERLKVQEHEDFFLRFGQAGLQAAYCPEVTAQHWNSQSPRRYSQYRGRSFLPLALALHGFTRYTTPDGIVIEALSAAQTAEALGTVAGEPRMVRLDSPRQGRLGHEQPFAHDHSAA